MTFKVQTGGIGKDVEALLMTLVDGLADLGSALGALQAASDILKNWASLRSDSERAAKLREFNGQILAAQTSAIQANAAQTALIKELSALEAKLANFETWDAEKQRYELKDLGWGAFAYMLKLAARGSEPPHWVCTNCYGDRRISVIQHTNMKKGEGYGYFCPKCHNEIRPSTQSFDGDSPKWL